MSITPTGRIVCGGQTYAAPLVQQADIRACKPAQEIYDLACSPTIVDCLLFRKQAFLAKKNTLRTLLAQAPMVEPASASTTPSVTEFRPPTGPEWTRRLNDAQTRLNWCRRVIQLVEDTLADTNIQPMWLLGGDIPTRPDRVTHTATLPPDLWAATYTVVSDMYRASRAQGYGVLDMGKLDSTKRITAVNFQLNASLFWAGQDFEAPLAASSSGPVMVTGAQGLGAFSGLPTWWTTMRVPMAVQSAYFHFQPGVNYDALFAPHYGLVRGPESQQNRERLIVNYGVYCPGRRFYRTTVGSLNKTQMETRARDETPHAVPGLDWIVAYCRALLEDVLTQPFEVYVLYGMEQWANNMAVWAQNGFIDVPVDRFRQMAQQIVSIRGTGEFRLAMTSAAGLAAGIASMVNPIAGAVVGAVSMVVNLLLEKFGAIGGWYCPTPLTLRSATGACDFSRVVGENATERLAAQAGALSDRARADLELEAERQAALLQQAAGPAWLAPLLVGGAAFGVGLGIAALARRS